MKIIEKIIFGIVTICASTSIYGAEHDSQSKAAADFHRGVAQIRCLVGSTLFQGVHTDTSTRDRTADQIISLKETLLPHLTRPFTQVQFDESGSLTIDENEKFFYAVMNHINFFVSCRGEPADNAYYTDDSPQPPTFYHSGPHYNFFGPLYKKLNYAGAPCHIQEPNDVYYVRNFLNDFELQTLAETTPKAPILIIPTLKHGHAFLTLHILDLENKRVLTSILINSMEGNYNKSMMELFNIKYNIFRYTQTPDQKDWVHKRFPDTAPFVNDYQFACNWTIPIIDCSYHVQTASDDRNCTFYTYITTLTLLNMFKNNILLKDILIKAQQIFQDPQNQDLQTSMSLFFKKQLLAELPQLFNASGERRSDGEIKQYFMNLRWDLTSEWIKLFMNKDL